MNSFLQALKDRVLVLDGAMGTMLQERGLAPGGCPEEMNLAVPEVVAAVHREYAQAGADVIVTNTFGGNRVKLGHYGLGARVGEINARAVELARRAAPEGFVALSLGPTGRFLEPVGDAGFDEMVEVFGEQVRAGAEAGADLLSCETFLDIRELRAAVVACREFSRLPVIAQMTFDDGGRSVLGSPPEAAAVTLEGLGVDVIGSNCGLGPEGIVALLEKMRSVSRLPLISQANAGLPQLIDGETVFPGTPEEMTAFHGRMIALGVRIIGGCCGTTPAHIRAIRAALEGRDLSWSPPPRRLFLSSRGAVVPVGGAAPCAVIGERINPTGKKAYSAELREGKTAYIRREAQEQEAAGATLLDVNCGAPGVDEPAALERAVYAVSGVASAPLVLDSSDPAALERGLKAADGRVLINSVSGEAKSLAAILPLARKYGAAVIGLALDEEGIPATAAGRVAVAGKILAAAREAGLADSDLVIDGLVLTVSAEQKSAPETLRTLRLIKSELGLATVLGVSNISYGLPSRGILSAAFFAMALEAGLDAAIINPKEERMMDAFRAAMVLLGRDERAEEFIAHYGGVSAPPAVPQAVGATAGIRERLATAIIEGDREGVLALVDEACAGGLEPMAISNEGLLPGLEEVGRRFGAKQIFLPQVMLSAETMHAAFARIKERMPGEIGPRLGRILMATVEGDIHDIGKNIVCTLLENHGFEVIDLGKNVPAERIVSVARERRVDAVGLSALMTTTLAQMERTIEQLHAEGIKAFTLVGGAVVTEDYAARIGADLYGGDAMSAVEKIKRLLIK
ncbi:homocysteine S-methyltransferase family protein [Geoalkalibacter halelectricus]|uniref:Methionine synthase n=1 Tax=Geoalkalibacter halelectricus TaxID=2847045 RepID=A0ABY5ZNX3_9BACT|nr:homocysteine S-methyltransferase family protein [Geoalkalibacter halelectricus]MDO3377478.1 homocysteine S-methyltransferase family protein [Geoalkalibacter halelectricus]UWZ80763.1 homocysteine S-methyltransferase family protein [Geoalkalibacter halelectricus]